MSESLPSSPDAKLWQAIVQDTQLREGALVIQGYAEAKQQSRGLDELKGMRWWQPDQGGQVFQIGPDDTPAAGAETPSLFDAEAYLEYHSRLNHLVGQPVKPAGTARRAMFSRFRRQQEPQRADLSVMRVTGSDWYQVRVGAETMPLLFDTAELHDNVVHGVAGQRKLAFKVTPVDATAVASATEQRRAGENAQRTVDQTKLAMIQALCATARDILERYGADNIVRDKREGVSHYTYGTPESVTFDFVLDGSNISLFFTEGSIDVIMSSGHISIEDAYQEMHGLEMDRSFPLAAVDAAPLFFKDPFEGIRAAQTFPEEITAIYQMQGLRHFAVSYNEVFITEALPLVLDLLRAPIDANHSLLTPYHNGIRVPRVYLDVIGPRNIRATIVGDDSKEIAGDYTLEANGILERVS